MGVALGIVVKFIFENFVYTFGGKYFLQKRGAPIGNRISMCGAQITMQEWREKFIDILIKSKIEEIELVASKGVSSSNLLSCQATANLT